MTGPLDDLLELSFWHPARALRESAGLVRQEEPILRARGLLVAAVSAFHLGSEPVGRDLLARAIRMARGDDREFWFAVAGVLAHAYRTQGDQIRAEAQANIQVLMARLEAEKGQAYVGRSSIFRWSNDPSSVLTDAVAGLLYLDALRGQRHWLIGHLNAAGALAQLGHAQHSLKFLDRGFDAVTTTDERIRLRRNWIRAGAMASLDQPERALSSYLEVLEKATQEDWGLEVAQVALEAAAVCISTGQMASTQTLAHYSFIVFRAFRHYEEATQAFATFFESCRRQRVTADCIRDAAATVSSTVLRRFLSQLGAVPASAGL